MDVAGRRITVMGLGCHGGGLAVARWLAVQGAEVTITDLAAAAVLAESRAALAQVPIAHWTLGRHDERDFAAAEVVVVNPAVKPGHPLVELARAAGARITCEIELFLDECRARVVVGVTGSNGKSTTATLLAAMLRAGGQRVWLGGNIGVSLLDRLSAIGRNDIVVLELSSFQLALMSNKARWPQMALVTNLTPNHLDWHGSMPAYAAAKRRLIEHLPPGGTAIVAGGDQLPSDWLAGSTAEVKAVGRLPAGVPLGILGDHNRRNAALAVGAASCLGVSQTAIDETLRRFSGLEHRIELVGEVAGRRFFDDSKSTTPEATVVALAAIGRPSWLLAGGVNKGLCFNRLATEIVERACGAAFFGAAGQTLSAVTARARDDFSQEALPTLGEALAWCFARSRPGDAVLLSPACASFDQFRDYRHRGQVFRSAMQQLAAEHRLQILLASEAR